MQSDRPVPIATQQASRAILQRSDGTDVDLRNIYSGSSAFLLCGGPSLRSIDLSVLSVRGVLICAVNNVATLVRPHLWVSIDNPGNFSDAIWRDSGIWKFLPVSHFDQLLTVRDHDGRLQLSTACAAEMPAVFGFPTNANFQPERWLFEESFNCGNEASIRDADGNFGGRSVMLVALRLLFHLGIRRVYLLGCDFRMPLSAPHYAFAQARSRASVQNNNGAYRVLNCRFQHLKPHFDAAGFQVFNCTEESQLQVFPRIKFADALVEMTARIPKTIKTEGMYDRLQRERDTQRASDQRAD